MRDASRNWRPTKFPGPISDLCTRGPQQLKLELENPCRPRAAGDRTRSRRHRCGTTALDGRAPRKQNSSRSACPRQSVAPSSSRWPGRDPGIDEPGQPVESAEVRRRRSDDPLVFRRIPFEIEIAHQDRVGRHRRHLAFGPARVGLRMSAAPCAALARRARMDCEQRFDLRQPRRRAQMAQVRRVDSHRPRAPRRRSPPRARPAGCCAASAFRISAAGDCATTRSAGATAPSCRTAGAG